MVRVMTVFGTRPEAIKMAPLVKELDSRENIESIVCVTAQHRQMLDQVLDTFDIKPQYDLNIMKQGQTLTEITTRAMQKLDEVINALGYKNNPKPLKTSTSDVIDALEKGEISPQEAIERMKEK